MKRRNNEKEIDFIKPKAYFIDIDGTLVSGHKDAKLHVDDLHAIKRAVRNETYIILSTGRSLPDLKKIWQQIDDGSDFTRYAIVNNGSGIWDMRKRKMIFEAYLDKESFQSVFAYAKENGYAVKNSLENAFYVNPGLLAWLLKRFSSRNEVLNDFDRPVYNNRSAKKLGMIAHYSKKKVKLIAKDIDSKLPHVDVAVSGPGLYIEINKHGVSKGTALEFVVKLLGIDIKETVHIGDSMNDAEGFKSAGYGVAMGNAMKELKEISDFITLDRKRAGVANTIKSFGNV